VRLRGKYYEWKYNIGVEDAASVTDSYEEINELAIRQYKLSLEMFVDLAHNIQAVPIIVTQARLADEKNTPGRN